MTHLVTRQAYNSLVSSVTKGRSLLDNHAATPWSGVHGSFPVAEQDYTNSNNELVASNVVTFETDGVRYYVPAKDDSGAVLDPDPPSGPVDALSIWKLEDSQASPVRLDSVGGRHLTPGGVVLRDTGKFGNCAKFSGTGRLLVPCDNSLAFASRSFSLTLWVKFSALTNGAVIAAKAKDSSTSEFRLRVVQTGPTSNIEASLGSYSVLNTAEVLVDTWYFVAAVFDRTFSSLRLYVGSTITSGVAGNVNTIPESPYLSFGSYSGGTSAMSGWIDSVRFFNRDLSADEIGTLYGFGNGLVGIIAPGNTAGIHSSAPSINRDEPEHQRLASSNVDFDNLSKVIQSDVDRLRAHILAEMPDVHRGFSVINRITKDSGGYVVGRFLLSVGIGSRQYGIVADTSPAGPPKTVKMSPACPTGVFVGASGVNCSLDNCRFRVISDGGGSGEKFPSEVTISFNLTVGTGPIKYSWQWSSDGGANWNDVATQGAVVRGGGIVPTQDSKGNWAHVGEIQTTPSLFKTTWSVRSPGGDNGSGWLMRVKFDNSHIGGGVVYSSTIDCYIQDHSDSFLCTMLYSAGLLSVEEYVDDLKHGATIDPEVKAGYRLWSKPLAALCRRYPRVRRIVQVPVQEWCKHVSFKSGTRPTDSWVGKMVGAVGTPVCRWLGKS